MWIFLLHFQRYNVDICPWKWSDGQMDGIHIFEDGLDRTYRWRSELDLFLSFKLCLLLNLTQGIEVEGIYYCSSIFLSTTLWWIWKIELYADESGETEIFWCIESQLSRNASLCAAHLNQQALIKLTASGWSLSTSWCN